MEFWNIRSLPEPPEISVKYTIQDYEAFTSSANKNLLQELSHEKWVREVRRVVSDGVRKMWESDDMLHRERKLLSAFLYHRENPFRSEKFLQCIKKVSKCLRNWSDLQIGVLLYNTMEMIPLAFDVVDNIHMPTFQRMHFLMLKLLGGFKLLLHISTSCITTASVLRSKMMAGHSYLNIYLLFGYVARIRAICLYLASHISNIYTRLCPLIEKVVEKSNLEYSKTLQKDLDLELMEAAKNPQRSKGELPSELQSRFSSESSTHAQSELTHVDVFSKENAKERCESDSEMPLISELEGELDHGFEDLGDIVGCKEDKIAKGSEKRDMFLKSKRRKSKGKLKKVKNSSMEECSESLVHNKKFNKLKSKKLCIEKIADINANTDIIETMNNLSKFLMKKRNKVIQSGKIGTENFVEIGEKNFNLKNRKKSEKSMKKKLKLKKNISGDLNKDAEYKNKLKLKYKEKRKKKPTRPVKNSLLKF